jgi:hypothetical protein
MAEEIRQIFQWNIEYYQSQCFGKCLTEANLYGVRNQMRNLLFANLQITTTLLRFNEDWTKRLRMMGSIWGGFKGGIVKQPKTTNSLMTQRIILDSESCMQGNLHVQFGGGENSVRNLPIPTWTFKTGKSGISGMVNGNPSLRSRTGCERLPEAPWLQNRLIHLNAISQKAKHLDWGLPSYLSQ